MGIMMYHSFIAALLAGLFASAASAETYICKVRPDGHDLGWISKTIAINIDDKTGEVLVSDAIILRAFKKPILAELVINTPKRLTVKWEVSGLKDVRNVTYTRFMYRVTILKARGNRAIVKANAAGYFQPLGGSGKCTLRK